jgi:hypothetical protein
VQDLGPVRDFLLSGGSHGAPKASQGKPPERASQRRGDSVVGCDPLTDRTRKPHSGYGNTIDFGLTTLITWGDDANKNPSPR